MRTYAFVDGAFLRAIAAAAKREPFNPQEVAKNVCKNSDNFCNYVAKLSRTIYFDAEPDSDGSQLEGYWNAVELLDDTHLAFGWIRGKTKRRGSSQKAVDTLLAVEMVSGAYNRRYDVALLIAGDADFVPIVNEVRRAGPHVIVAAANDPSGETNFAFSDKLRRAADRFFELPNDPADEEYHTFFKSLPVGSLD